MQVIKHDVESFTEPGLFYMVYEFQNDDGTSVFKCDCPAFSMSKEEPKICKHIRKVKGGELPNE